mmetsp:Transcript_892/g.1783  ORF Transcript_892/g.1783 Transcript_892/m.1783 type:complete len:262 (+) Transcript_892:476-1261(+)
MEALFFRRHLLLRTAQLCTVTRCRRPQTLKLPTKRDNNVITLQQHALKLSAVLEQPLYIGSVTSLCTGNLFFQTGELIQQANIFLEEHALPVPQSGNLLIPCGVQRNHRMLPLQRLPFTSPLQLTDLPILLSEPHLERPHVSFASALQIPALLTRFLLPSADHALLSLPHCDNLCIHLGILVANVTLGLNTQFIFTLLQFHLRLLEGRRFHFTFLSPLHNLFLGDAQVPFSHPGLVFTGSQLEGELSGRGTFLGSFTLQVN